MKVSTFALIVLTAFFSTTAYAEDKTSAADEGAKCWAAAEADTKYTDAMSVPGFQDIPSTDTTPVCIILNHTTRLKIPRNYLVDAAVAFVPPATLYIEMEMTYPEFKGAEQENIFDFHTERSWKRDDMVIIQQIDNWDYYADTQHMFKEIEKNVGPINSDPIYKIGVLAYHIGYLGLKKNSILITCPNIEDPDSLNGPSRLCSVKENIAPGFAIQYEYSYKLLPHWKEIHLGVTKLLKSFVVEN